MKQDKTSILKHQAKMYAKDTLQLQQTLAVNLQAVAYLAIAEARDKKAAMCAKRIVQFTGRKAGDFTYAEFKAEIVALGITEDSADETYAACCIVNAWRRLQEAESIQEVKAWI